MSVLAVYDCMLFFLQATQPQRIRETFRLVEVGDVILCLSTEIVDEIKSVLLRPKYQVKFPASTPDAIEAFLQSLKERAVFVDPVPDLYTLQRDPADSKYINLALAANAKYLVTRDRDLLDLMNLTIPESAAFRSQFPDLQILQPREFVQQIQIDT